MTFREENHFLIYITAWFGLYLRSIEAVTSNRRTIAFFTFWTKLPISLFPIYIGFDIYSLLFDEAPILIKFAMIRKVVAFMGFFLKNVLFYVNRKKIERLFDQWDESFKEEFYSDEVLVYNRNNKEENKKLIKVSIILAVIAACCYSIPAYFSKKKQFTHPSGIKYPYRSPEFEIVVTFDVICSLSCVSAAAFDCILIVLLSHVRSKLEFLRDALTDIINGFVIDRDGRLMGRRDDSVRSFVPPPELNDEGFSNYKETEPDDERFKRNTQIVEAKLRIWILHHQQTISVFEELKKVYSSTATLELGYIVVYVGLTALQLVQVKPGAVTIGIALVASSNLMSLFLWCKLGAELEEIQVFSDAFSRAWFLFPRKIKTAFSFIIMRSKKPLSLFGITLYAVNLVTFFEILKLTYQFFAFMVQITTKDE